jgi:Protein of unknown function (DUF2934)
VVRDCRVVARAARHASIRLPERGAIPTFPVSACDGSLFVNHAAGEKGPTIAQDAHMDHSLENRIRERAYEMWTAQGRAHGQAEQHWLAAEREILTAATTELARDKVPQKKKRRSPTRSKVPRPLKAAS